MKKRETRPTTRVLVTLVKDDYEWIVEQAAKDDLSFTALVRQLLREYMVKKKAKKS